MTKLLLIRHGFSSGNKEKRFSGQMDLPLSEEGLRQAHLACEYILNNYQVGALYASDLVRAVDTVEPLSKELGLPIVALINGNSAERRLRVPPSLDSRDIKLPVFDVRAFERFGQFLSQYAE